MKKLLTILLVTIMIPINAFALSTTDAKESIEKNRLNNLKIDYEYDSLNFDGYNTYLYYLADIDENLQFKLLESLPNDFKNIKINGIDSQLKWDNLRETIDSYIVANNLKATYTAKIRNNKSVFNNLKSGLYYVETEMITKDNYKIEFAPTIISLPYLNDTGTWNYDTTICPKASEVIYKENFNVTKIWSNHPSVNSINVEIYRDNELYDSIVLSNNNNWTYSWSVFDGIISKWNVIEKNIPKDYNVEITNNNGNFIISNTLIPKTGDNIKTYIFTGFISLLFMTILLSIMKVKSSNND